MEGLKSELKLNLQSKYINTQEDIDFFNKAFKALLEQ